MLSFDLGLGHKTEFCGLDGLGFGAFWSWSWPWHLWSWSWSWPAWSCLTMCWQSILSQNCTRNWPIIKVPCMICDAKLLRYVMQSQDSPGREQQQEKQLQMYIEHSNSPTSMSTSLSEVCNSRNSHCCGSSLSACYAHQQVLLGQSRYSHKVDCCWGHTVHARLMDFWSRLYSLSAISLTGITYIIVTCDSDADFCTDVQV